YDRRNPSPFISEFINTVIPQTPVALEIPEADLCPKCHCGRIRVVKKGVAVNGNPYTMFACTNEKYGCDYMETQFVNLNSTYRNYRY
ncbi:MAG: hypothetical protein K6F58_07370, partial [Bacteroidales bacterium]|nr:hypothetical protein [Bacteroidales bacterium]